MNSAHLTSPRSDFQNQVKEGEEVILRCPGKTVATRILIGHEGSPEAGRHLHTNLKKSVQEGKKRRRWSGCKCEEIANESNGRSYW